MGHLYDARDRAIAHEVEKDDTLSAIAAAYRGKHGVPDDLDWKELALYNWATIAEAEVVRALCERVGAADPAATLTGAAPGTLKLDPKFGPSTPERILVPKLWQAKGLAVNRQHKIEARRRSPALSVGITKIDKWFIPDHETCDVDYVAHGDVEETAAVAFEVYASGYGKLRDWKGGLPEFDPLPGVPVYTAAAEGGAVRGWKGLTSCTEGALAPAGSPLNVVFSPYTAVLRHARPGSHAGARITLAPFWPTFDAEGKPAPSSCKVAWKLEQADDLRHGLLIVCDRAGAAVFARGLDADDLAAGEHAWDGNDAAGRPVTADRMPYRVQLQAHTGIDCEDGLALAAAHTEVRLYVHGGTLALDVDPYVPTDDRTSLDLSIADVHPADAAPERSAGTLWTKYKLAAAGFHPGPVDDVVDDEFTAALHEFQRSVPKGGGAGDPPFVRMALGPDGEDTGDALAALEDRRRRPWFGKPADPGDAVTLAWRPGNWTDTGAADFLERLRDPGKRMIVWVDDRNWYTDGEYWKYGFYDDRVIVSQANLDKVHSAPEDLGGASKTDGRGSFEHRDDRVAYDVRDVARPWIPLQVDLRLLGKAQELDAEVGPHQPELAAKVRAAIGPLRVDWTFDEIEATAAVEGVTEGDAAVAQELPVLDRESDILLSYLYHPSATRTKYTRPQGNRTRMALRWALDQLKKEHDRKDVTRRSRYYNAPATRGGIRPDDVDAYFKAPFGHGERSLAPWTAAPDAARQSIVTAVHDRAGREDTAEVYAKRVGRAGVYLHPSRIAGDGYQVRAQVRFDAAGPYVSPNAAALAARYPRPPQAQSVQLRLWRKTSIRGFVQWAPTEAWSSVAGTAANQPQTGPNEWRSYYTACHVAIENELGAADSALKLPGSSVFASADDFRELVADTLDPDDPRADEVNLHLMTLANQYVWPWHRLADYGMPPVFNADFGKGAGEIDSKVKILHVAVAFRLSLAMVKAIEATTGRMRGHVLVQYQTSPPFFFAMYVCDVCRQSAVYVQNAKGAVLLNRRCQAPACTGRLRTFRGASGEYPQLSSPSCGFPVGVFWNVSGDARLWAHELGHNRHYEHSADAPAKPDDKARDDHDRPANPFITHPTEKDKNKGWDRACLMSYVSYARDTGNASTYDDKRDMPCFCFKCVLKNRGWRLADLPTPASDLQDVAGVSP
ncbi:MAG: hypothetical protein JNL82_37710 [Myxococcales bacterium]|nr:hypothetical protein [Myxococcales bacterium]